MFYKILLDIMDEKKLSIPEVARITGLADSTVRSIISRKSKTVALEVAFKISKGLDVSIERLSGFPQFESEITESLKDASIITKTEFTLDEINHVQKYRKLDLHGKQLVDTIIDFELEQVKERHFEDNKKQNPVRLLDYYHKMASAGNGEYLSDDTVSTKIEIPNIDKFKNVDFAIGVNGDSMKPLFEDGSILLIHRTPDVSIDEPGLFILNGESYIKILGDGCLISANPNYPDIPIREGDVLRCIGNVVSIFEEAETPEDRIRYLDDRKQFIKDNGLRSAASNGMTNNLDELENELDDFDPGDSNDALE